MSRCGLVILAGGAASRLGEPKQLLPIEGEAMLVRVVRLGLQSEANPVVVVLGAHANACEEALVGLPVILVKNEAWREGIASSIRAGIEALDEEIEGVLIVLADQPLISAPLIHDLIHSGQSIAASAYADTLGPPAFFERRFFPKLLALQGDSGAKHVIRAHADEVAVIDFAEGEFDIDTAQDYQQLVTSGVLAHHEITVL